jgi:hypothetical protein
MEHHNISIEPPDQLYKHFRVNCSYGDLTDRPARTRIEAKEIAYGHVSDVFKMAWDKEQGITKVESMEEFNEFFREILNLPLDVSGIE